MATPILEPLCRLIPAELVPELQLLRASARNERVWQAYLQPRCSYALEELIEVLQKIPNPVAPYVWLHLWKTGIYVNQKALDGKGSLAFLAAFRNVFSSWPTLLVWAINSYRYHNAHLIFTQFSGQLPALLATPHRAVVLGALLKGLERNQTIQTICARLASEEPEVVRAYILNNLDHVMPAHRPRVTALALALTARPEPLRSDLDPLTQAERALQEGNFAQAALCLRQVWEKDPGDNLARFLVDLPNSVTLPVFPNEAAQNIWWNGLAQAANPADLPLLLAAPWPTSIKLASGRIEALQKFPKDPRIAARLVRLHLGYDLEPRVSRAAMALVEQTDFFDLLTQSGYKAAQNTARFQSIAMGPNLQHRLKTPRIFDPETLSRLAALLPKTTTEVSLLTVVYRAHDDNQPRLVFADYLLEKGDPWGRFIQRALDFSDIPSQDRRSQKQHALLTQRWVEKCIGLSATTIAFERGFPSIGMLCGLTGMKDAILACPYWRTLTNLLVENTTDPEILNAVLEPTFLPSLHTLGWLDASTTLPYRPGIKKVSLHCYKGPVCINLDALPDLEEVEVELDDLEALLPILARCRAHTLSSLRYFTDFNGEETTRNALLACNTLPECFQTIQFYENSQLTRDAHGQFTRLAFESWETESVTFVLNLLPPDYVTWFRLICLSGVSKERMRELKMALQRHPRAVIDALGTPQPDSRRRRSNKNPHDP